MLTYVVSDGDIYLLIRRFFHQILLIIFLFLHKKHSLCSLIRTFSVYQHILQYPLILEGDIERLASASVQSKIGILCSSTYSLVSIESVRSY